MGERVLRCPVRAGRGGLGRLRRRSGPTNRVLCRRLWGFVCGAAGVARSAVEESSSRPWGGIGRALLWALWERCSPADTYPVAGRTGATRSSFRYARTAWTVPRASGAPARRGDTRCARAGSRAKEVLYDPGVDPEPRCPWENVEPSLLQARSELPAASPAWATSSPRRSTCQVCVPVPYRVAIRWRPRS